MYCLWGMHTLHGVHTLSVYSEQLVSTCWSVAMQDCVEQVLHRDGKVDVQLTYTQSSGPLGHTVASRS